ncbi:hypothetical protein GBF35_26940 [Nonomuraea phyllanthi]|uniref:hypothetical protein n=1 Tax=Nonomuraea phyllanthi TaxID=2219224 RepID=UPI0012935D2D|nr:hypothetical protein [Nonomuraea phyllanthi]QFY09802.1 hypothetical protein GBF35_26940 [Nonomuraea phyllanthi]
MDSDGKMASTHLRSDRLHHRDNDRLLNLIGRSASLIAGPAGSTWPTGRPSHGRAAVPKVTAGPDRTMTAHHSRAKAARLHFS